MLISMLMSFGLNMVVGHKRCRGVGAANPHELFLTKS